MTHRTSKKHKKIAENNECEVQKPMMQSAVSSEKKEPNLVIEQNNLMAKSSTCEFCGNEPKFRCASCRRALYCGRAHQIQDWLNHRVLCRLHQTVKDIKHSKRHRVDKIIENRRDGRLQRPLVCPKTIKETPETPGTFIAHNRRSSPNTIALTEKIIQDLALRGFSVIDSFVSDNLVDAILRDVRNLYSREDAFVPGTLTTAKDSSSIKTDTIRGDMVMWLDIFAQTTHAAIRSAEMSMSKIVNILNNSELMNGSAIRSRSRVMVACYPGNGTKYKRHVDNPSGDGRKLTFILYLNKDYNRARDGGVLRMFPRDTDQYFDIEPTAGRLAIFWSDFRNPHEVLPAYSERFAISIWYFDIVERARSFVNCEMVSNATAVS